MTLVAITYNLKKKPAKGLPEDFYSEFDEKSTISAIESAIRKAGFKTARIEADEKAYIKLKKMRPDFVFNIAEGLRGRSRESQIPAMLELLEIPYLASDPTTLSIGLNKAMTKDMLIQNRIPTAAFQVFYKADEKLLRKLHFPLMVKPLYEGSSKGIKNDCVVKNDAELRKKLSEIIAAYEQPALVEEFLSGRELTVAVIGNDEPIALPILEIVFDSLPPEANPIYSYEAKWVWDTKENPINVVSCPARISPYLKRRIEKIAIQTYRALNVRDWCRIDMRLGKHNRPYVLEINPLPGIGPDPVEHSNLPAMWYSMGLKYEQLINTVLYYAMKRAGINHNFKDSLAVKDLKKYVRRANRKVR
ncbi:MAG: ATP-grasp domain-containing protein [Candidatus Woesearchaeota archaeon]|nr:ATP-grasp domain-containing protein [Candidatus Woesearchaeota archaeon]